MQGVSEFDNIVKLIQFTGKYQLVTRDIDVVDGSRKENDAEHSHQLAVVAWYISDFYQLPYSRELILQYAIVHDMVEIYAGDTSAFHSHESEQLTKHEREHRAALQIKKELPFFGNLHQTIEQYERKSDNESLFVYIIDKILPDTNVILSGENYYRKNMIGYDVWTRWATDKKAKISYSREIDNGVFLQFEEFIRSHREMLFPF